jgi:hypothetical protein
MTIRLAAFAIAVAACHSSSSSGPPAIELPGPANGLWWDAAHHELDLTDDAHDQIVRWTDAHGIEPVGALPPAPKVGLGGLVRLADGRFVATSFGFGTDGGVVTLADGKASEVPSLDKARRRIGLAVASDGALYVAYFVVGANHEHTGGIAKLELDGRETDLVIPDLGKAVGLAVADKTLFIADQERGQILGYDLATAATRVVAKNLRGVDLLTLLPNGDFITGGKHGEVYRIGHDGAATTLTTFATGGQVRGTAYDADGKRLFAVEHVGKDAPDRLHIIPLAI